MRHWFLTKDALRSLAQACLHCRHSAGLLQRYTSRNRWRCDQTAVISSEYRRSFSIRNIGATTVRTGGDWSPNFSVGGTNNVLVPQFLGHNFKKARNFTASSHQNAGFSIRVFKNFPGVIPLDPLSRRGRPPPARPGAGRKRPSVGTQSLVPSTFQPWLRPWSGTIFRVGDFKYATQHFKEVKGVAIATKFGQKKSPNWTKHPV